MEEGGERGERRGEKQENRGRVLKGEEVKEVMAAVTLMQPAAQDAKDQYR